MNVFDLIILALLTALTLRGIWKGMVSQIVSVASYFVCWIVATRFGSLVAPTIPVEAPWDQVLAMAIVFLITFVAIRFAHATLEKLIKDWHLAKLNTLLGGVLGFIKGLLLCLIITFFGVMVSETSRDVVFNSKSGFHLVRLTTQIGMFVPKDSYEFVHTQFAYFQERVDGAVPGKTPEMMQVQSSETFQQLREKTEASAGSLLAALSQWWNGTSGNVAQSGSTEEQPATPYIPPLPPFLSQNNTFTDIPTNIPQPVTPQQAVAAEPFFIRQPEANVIPSMQSPSMQPLTPMSPPVPSAFDSQPSPLSLPPSLPPMPALAPLTEVLSIIPPEPVALMPLMPLRHHVGSDLLLRNSTQSANPDAPARVFRP